MFTESERRIFGPYGDGTGAQVYADPIAAWRRLMVATQAELPAILSQYNGDEPGAFVAAEKLASAAAVAFEITAFDKTTGQGALQEECLQILANFLRWRAEKKTKEESLPISAPPTVTAPNGPPVQIRVHRQHGQPGQPPRQALRPTMPSG